MRRRDDLEGRLLTNALELFGSPPIEDHVARASDLRGEFYTPITARFPPSDPASRSIVVREVRWLRGERYFAAFCQRDRGAWVVFHAVEWRKGIVF